MPLLTIAIPTLNGEAFLRDTVEAILHGLNFGRDVEVLLMENGSSDNTAGICKEFADTNPNVVMRSNSETVSFDENVAGAIEAATGEYVWIMADDDVIIPGAIQRVYAELEANLPSLLLTNFRKVGRDLEPLEPKSLNSDRAGLGSQAVKVFETAEDALMGASFDIFGLLSAIVVRREDYLKFAYGTGIGLPEGFDFLYIIPRVMQLGRTVFIDEPLVLFRQYKKRWETRDDYSQSMTIFFVIIPTILNQLAVDGYEKTVVGSISRHHLANLSLQLITAAAAGMNYRDGFLRKLISVNFRNPIFWIQLPVFALPKKLLPKVALLYEGTLSNTLRRALS